MPRIAVLALVLSLGLFPFIGLQDGWTGLWEDEGCILEPGGRCAPAPSQDAGCGLDPGGVPCSDRQ